MIPKEETEDHSSGSHEFNRDHGREIHLIDPKDLELPSLEKMEKMMGELSGTSFLEKDHSSTYIGEKLNLQIGGKEITIRGGLLSDNSNSDKGLQFCIGLSDYEGIKLLDKISSFLEKWNVFTPEFNPKVEAGIPKVSLELKGTVEIDIPFVAESLTSKLAFSTEQGRTVTSGITHERTFSREIKAGASGSVEGCLTVKFNDDKLSHLDELEKQYRLP